jgi:hypothetical protein
MFPMMFPKMSSGMMTQLKNGLSTGKPMEQNAPAAGAMNVANMKSATNGATNGGGDKVGKAVGGMLDKLKAKGPTL